MKLHFCFQRAVLCILLFAFAICISAQNLTLSGTVTDTKGEVVIGASILVEGTNNGSITDLDGNFTIPNVSPDATLTNILYWIQDSTDKSCRKNDLQNYPDRRH